MTMLIREGTLEEAIQVVARVTEFARGETVESMAERLGDKKSLILVAEKAGAILGFKIGYELDDYTFTAGLVVLRQKRAMRVWLRCYWKRKKNGSQSRATKR